MTDQRNWEVGDTPRADRLKRTGLMIPAALITLGLFTAMQQLIEVDDFEPPEAKRYLVQAYVEQVADPIDRTKNPKPVKPDLSAPPPLAPAPVKSVTVLNVPNSGYSGAAPADYGEIDLNTIKPLNISSVIDRKAQPIRPPVVVYPTRATELGLEGRCDVYFNVSPRGDAFDVDARCTDGVFERAAENAVRKSKFAPRIQDGRAVTVTGVIYPIEFRIEP